MQKTIFLSLSVCVVLIQTSLLPLIKGGSYVDLPLIVFILYVWAWEPLNFFRLESPDVDILVMGLWLGGWSGVCSRASWWCVVWAYLILGFIMNTLRGRRFSKWTTMRYISAFLFVALFYGVFVCVSYMDMRVWIPTSVQHVTPFVVKNFCLYGSVLVMIHIIRFKRKHRLPSRKS